MITLNFLQGINSKSRIIEKKKEYNRRKAVVHYYKNPRKALESNKKFRNSHREYEIWRFSKSRAFKYNLDFSISISDIFIPQICPILGIPLRSGNGKVSMNSPSLDRIDSTKGYIPGNIWVISFRANSIKRDSTVEELRMIADAVEYKLKGVL